MIDEKATFDEYGYYSTDLAQKSNKKIVAVCDDCGAARHPKKCDYRALCIRCVKKTDSFVEKQRADKLGKKLPEAQKQKIRDNAPRGEAHANWKGGVTILICKYCGKPYPHRVDNMDKSSFCSMKCKADAQSIYQTGSKRPPRTVEHLQKISAALQGIPHDEWDGFAARNNYCPKFNETCRERNRDKYDRLCFICGKSEEDNGEKLSVHHVDMSKSQGCDGEKWKLVPVCRTCHSMSHTKVWESRLEYLIDNVYA